MQRRTSIFTKIKSRIRSDNDALADRTPDSTANDHRKRSLAAETRFVPDKRRNKGSLGGSSGRYCDECDVLFSRPYTFYRHLDVIHGGPPKYLCDEPECDKLFTRSDLLDRHKSTQHGDGKVPCVLCGHLVRKDGLRAHEKTAACRKSQTLDVAEGEAGCEAQMKGTTSLQNSPSERVYRAPDQAAAPDASNLDSSVCNSVGDSTEQSCSNDYGIDVTVSIWEAPETNGASANMSCHQVEVESISKMEDYPISSARNPIGEARNDFGGTSQLLSTATEEAFSQLLLGKREEEELIQKIELSRAALKTSKTFKNADHRATSMGLGFLQPCKLSKQRYEMSLGSKCALCSNNLGRNVKSVVEHAKSHVQGYNRLGYTCDSCLVPFVFETDFKLHSSLLLEPWSFCSKVPLDSEYDEDDWVGQAFLSTRQSFIALLRQWESLQLHWYLSAIDTIVHRNTFQPLAARPEIDIAAEHNTLYFPDRAKTTVNAYIEDMCSITPRGATTAFYAKTWESEAPKSLQALLDKFEGLSLEQATPSRKPIPRSLPPLTGAIEHVFPLVQPRIWNAVEYESRRIFEDVLHDIKSKCATQEMFELILETALREAAWEGNLPLISRLFAVGTNINAIYESSGPSALMHATINGQTESVEFLINIGARINATCSKGLSALHYACEYAYEDIVLELILRAADVNLRDGLGNTPLMRTTTQNDLGSPRILPIVTRRESIVEILVRGGADINSKNDEGQTALHRASSLNLTSVVKSLLTLGAQWDVLDNLGRTPLVCAVTEGSYDSARALLDFATEQKLTDQVAS